jgi:3-oxoacyl-[acyl-carrier protein] reductase
MSRQLDGKVAVVTGAGRGIGRATAIALAREGADVACVARTASQLAETAALVRAAGRRARQIHADIGEPRAPSLIAAKVLADLGAIDILVNNAATVQPAGPTATAEPEDWTRAVAVNLTGPVRLTLAVLDAMIKKGYGRIVNVSSGIAAAPGAMPGLNAYAASKAALEAHTLGLAAELAGTGVTVNIVRPGPVDTAMPAWILAQPPAQIGAGLHDRFVAMRDAGLLASPAQPARMIAGLVTGETTGQIAGAAAPATIPALPAVLATSAISRSAGTAAAGIVVT